MAATALLLPVAFALLASVASAESVLVGDFAVTSQYQTCQDGAPASASIVDNCPSGGIDECGIDSSGSDLNYPFSTVTSCGTDINSIVEQLFGNETYLRFDSFYDDDCTSWESTNVLLVTGECIKQLGYDGGGIDASYLPLVYANGSAWWAWYLGTDCNGEAANASWVDAEQLRSNACVDKVKWYTNAVASDTVGSSNDAPRSVDVAASELVVASIAVLSAVLAVAT